MFLLLVRSLILVYFLLLLFLLLLLFDHLDVFLLFLFQTVNNKPEEKVKVSDNGALATGSRNLCDDIWDSEESTCGFDRDAEGNKIWDSQVNTK